MFCTSVENPVFNTDTHTVPYKAWLGVIITDHTIFLHNHPTCKGQQTTATLGILYTG